MFSFFLDCITEEKFISTQQKVAPKNCYPPKLNDLLACTAHPTCADDVPDSYCTSSPVQHIVSIGCYCTHADKFDNFYPVWLKFKKSHLIQLLLYPGPSTIFVLGMHIACMCVLKGLKMCLHNVYTMLLHPCPCNGFVLAVRMACIS